MEVRHHGERVVHSGKQRTKHNRGRIGKGDQPDRNEESNNSIDDPANAQNPNLPVRILGKGVVGLMARLLSNDRGS
jgi:hypothetical protein